MRHICGQDVLDYWLKVQITWMYLEPIFGSEDIMKQMPKEGAMFQTVDTSWKKIIKLGVADPKILSVIKIDGIMDMLTEANDLLEQVMVARGGALGQVGQEAVEGGAEGEGGSADGARALRAHVGRGAYNFWRRRADS